MSYVKICNTSTVYHLHTPMLFIGCIAHCILSLKKNELNHCYKKEKNMLYGALIEPVLELE